MVQGRMSWACGVYVWFQLIKSWKKLTLFFIPYPSPSCGENESSTLKPSISGKLSYSGIPSCVDRRYLFVIPYGLGFRDSSRTREAMFWEEPLKLERKGFWRNWKLIAKTEFQKEGRRGALALYFQFRIGGKLWASYRATSSFGQIQYRWEKTENLKKWSRGDRSELQMDYQKNCINGQFMIFKTTRFYATL